MHHEEPAIDARAHIGESKTRLEVEIAGAHLDGAAQNGVEQARGLALGFHRVGCPLFGGILQALPGRARTWLRGQMGEPLVPELIEVQGREASPLDSIAVQKSGGALARDHVGGIDNSQADLHAFEGEREHAILQDQLEREQPDQLRRDGVAGRALEGDGTRPVSRLDPMRQGARERDGSRGMAAQEGEEFRASHRYRGAVFAAANRGRARLAGEDAHFAEDIAPAKRLHQALDAQQFIPKKNLERAGIDEVQAVARIAVMHDDLAGLVLPAAHQRGGGPQISLIESAEEVHRGEQGKYIGFLGHGSSVAMLATRLRGVESFPNSPGVRVSLYFDFSALLKLNLNTQEMKVAS